MNSDIKKYLQPIGSKGGHSRAKNHSKDQLTAWAKLGGRPSKKEPVSPIRGGPAKS